MLSLEEKKTKSWQYCHVETNDRKSISVRSWWAARNAITILAYKGIL